MSRIYFTSEHGEAELYGMERHYMGAVVNRLAMTVVGPHHGVLVSHPHWALGLLPDDHYLKSLSFKDAHYAAESLETTLTVSIFNEETGIIRYGDQRLCPWDLNLNTALRIGNEAVKLLVRLHAQCEIHAYVEGPSRSWLADIMEQGRALGIYREGMGWESVIALLRSRDDGPVVTHYSVTDSFPGWLWPENEDDPEDEGRPLEWDEAMEALRARDGGLELTPGSLETVYYGPGEAPGISWYEVEAFARRDAALVT